MHPPSVCVCMCPRMYVCVFVCRRGSGSGDTRVRACSQSSPRVCKFKHTQTHTVIVVMPVLFVTVNARHSKTQACGYATHAASHCIPADKPASTMCVCVCACVFVSCRVTAGCKDIKHTKNEPPSRLQQTCKAHLTAPRPQTSENRINAGTYGAHPYHHKRLHRTYPPTHVALHHPTAQSGWTTQSAWASRQPTYTPTHATHPTHHHKRQLATQTPG